MVSIEYVPNLNSCNCQLTDEEAADFCRALSPLSVDDAFCNDDDIGTQDINYEDLPPAPVAFVQHHRQAMITQDNDKNYAEASDREASAVNIQQCTAGNNNRSKRAANDDSSVKARARVSAGYVLPSDAAGSGTAAASTTSTTKPTATSKPTKMGTVKSTMMSNQGPEGVLVSVVPDSTVPMESSGIETNKKLQVIIPTNLAKTSTSGKKQAQKSEQTNGRCIESSWDSRFNDLFAFHKRHGHSNVPEGAFNLHLWVREQKDQYNLRQLGKLPKGSEMNQARFEKLKDLGVFGRDERYQELHCNDQVWHTNFDALCKFKAKHGHFDGDSFHPHLSEWVYRQRWEYYNWKHDHPSWFPTDPLTDERRMKLDR